MKGSFSLDAFDPEINQQQASQILSAVDQVVRFHKWGQSHRVGEKCEPREREQHLMFEIGETIVRDGVRCVPTRTQHQSEIAATLDPALVPERYCRRYRKA
jgi:hypothetical protein